MMRFLSFLALLLLLATCMMGAAGGTESAVLAWDANPEPDIAGYRLSYGTAAGVYDHEEVVLNATELRVTGLAEWRTYFFAVAAFNERGQTGPVSDEISYFVVPDRPLDLATPADWTDGQDEPLAPLLPPVTTFPPRSGVMAFEVRAFAADLKTVVAKCYLVVPAGTAFAQMRITPVEIYTKEQP